MRAALEKKTAKDNETWERCYDYIKENLNNRKEEKWGSVPLNSFKQRMLENQPS